MNKLKYNKISKSDFLKLDENDLLFITNPGRMGDEDGSTFIIKDNNKLSIYRVDGWMYRSTNEGEVISLNDTLKQFPKWANAWKKNKSDKYTYLYMGFGNGLSIDNSIYSEFEPYLDNLVQDYLNNSNSDDKESLKYAAIFNLWEKAFIDMVNDKGYILNE